MSRGVGVKSIWPSLGALCVLLCRTRGARENTEGCGAWLLGASARRAVLAFCFPGAIGGDLGSARPWQLAGCKTLAARGNKMCSRLSTVQFANGPKRSMGHVLGAEKGNFLIRGRGRPTVYGGRGGILSILAGEVSLGSPRVGTIHVQSPTPHAPALQSFLVDFSQQPAELLAILVHWH